MFNFYTPRSINAISFLITLFSIFILSNFSKNIPKTDFRKTFLYYLWNSNVVKVQMETNGTSQNTKENVNNYLNNTLKNDFQNNSQNSITKENTLPENQINENQETKEETSPKKAQKNDWEIIIPAISLEAPIAEGTSKKVMNEFVGHFEETPKTLGNVALAAHNRGYPVNYFANLKKLKEGDEIFYQQGSFKKTYRVQKHTIIKDTDLTILEDTEDNRLTLITCVENEPTYRRCIQAVEVK